jgi:hypothetical protein
MRDPLIQLCMCPHTAMYVSSYCYVCVLILLCMCPHTSMYVSSYCYVCVLILLYICPNTAIYVSSYCNTRVRRPAETAALSLLVQRSSAAYVSTRQYTYVSIRPHTCGNRRTISFSAAVECCMSVWRMCGCAGSSVLSTTCIRQHTSAYVSIRQHTSASAYVSIRQIQRAQHHLNGARHSR